MMNKIYTFGCSLTANDWPNNLANSLGYDLENFALCAGDNMAQYKRFQDLYMNKQINKNDYFIFCRKCKTIIESDYRSPFDKRYCADCL